MNPQYSQSLVLNFSKKNKSGKNQNRNISLPHYSIIFKEDPTTQNYYTKNNRNNKSTQLSQNKPYNPRILQLCKPNKSQSLQKEPMVWIGVTKKNSQSNQNYQAFPKRNKKTADQSYHNFMLKYGKILKQSKQSRNSLQIHNKTASSMNAATAKLKPRLIWFGKVSTPNKYFSFKNQPRIQSATESPIKSRQKRSLLTNSGNKSVLELHDDEFSIKL